jgi:nucleoid-associated protein YgaU
MFRLDGTPVRAKVSISFEETPMSAAKQNPTSGGQPGRRTHLVTMGDSLASLAYREYGDPGLWRAIAAANGIDDPSRLHPGMSLLIPPLREAASSSTGGSP